MKVLWRPDSKAFALTATLWKRGSYIAIYRHDGIAFHEIKIPELEGDSWEPHGRQTFPQIVELNLQRAKGWQKDGSLVAKIETTRDGDSSTARATQTVVLGFDQSDQAKVLKSTMKVAIDPS